MITVLYVFVYLSRIISEVECELQVVEEVICKLWIHVKHLHEILPLNSAQVTVTQRSHVCVGFARLGVQMDHFSKDVIFT